VPKDFLPVPKAGLEFDVLGVVDFHAGFLEFLDHEELEEFGFLVVEFDLHSPPLNRVDPALKRTIASTLAQGWNPGPGRKNTDAMVVNTGIFNCELFLELGEWYDPGGWAVQGHPRREWR
jgi:hypothetical protein